MGHLLCAAVGTRVAASKTILQHETVLFSALEQLSGGQRAPRRR